MYEYKHGRYTYGDGIAIRAFEHGMPYGDVTVNLVDYDLHTKYNEIYIPVYKYDFNPNIVRTFISDLVEEVIEKTTIGPYNATVYKCKLKDNWKDICEEM